MEWVPRDPCTNNMSFKCLYSFTDAQFVVLPETFGNMTPKKMTGSLAASLNYITKRGLWFNGNHWHLPLLGEAPERPCHRPCIMCSFIRHTFSKRNMGFRYFFHRRTAEPHKKNCWKSRIAHLYCYHDFAVRTAVTAILTTKLAATATWTGPQISPRLMCHGQIEG